jgi:hypothetical protein
MRGREIPWASALGPALVGWTMRRGALSAFIIALPLMPRIGCVPFRAEERVPGRRVGQDFERYRKCARCWFGRGTPR